jgi:DNA-binding beta-propeller fold protein YncE
MAVTERDVWVTGNSPSMLARIDPETNRIVSQSSMDGSPCGIAVGPDGRLWIALLSVGRVVAIDPATGKVAATVEDLGSQLWDLKAGFGAIWVVDRSNRELLRIDPVSATVAARIPLGPSGSGLAITEAAVWVADDGDGTVRRIDPDTNAIRSTSVLRRGSAWFANDDRTVVVANRLDGSITPIKPTDGGPDDPIEGSRNPLDGTVWDGRAYIPDGKAGTLVEVDLATSVIGRVDDLGDARMPFVAEIGFGDVWVLDYGGRRIWRIEP